MLWRRFARVEVGAKNAGNAGRREMFLFADTYFYDSRCSFLIFF